MAAQIDARELRLTWTALASQPMAPGWTTIALGHAGPRFRAGIAYPEGHETLLVGFNGVTPPTDAETPRGEGFLVQHVPEASGRGFSYWIGVTRQASAALDMFAQMAVDILNSLAAAPDHGDGWLLQLMLARIRAWQEFMRRPRSGVLSGEEELGLVGELHVLEALVDAGIAPAAAVAAWQGPSGSMQDFIAPQHGIEVKSTLSAIGFPARISSLEQLDPALGRLVLLTGVRLCLQSDGRALPDVVQQLRRRLDGMPLPAASFERQLLHAGYFDAAAGEYIRRFSVVSIRVFAVDSTFPCLTRTSTRPEIRSAEYDVDLDLVETPATSLDIAISKHGVF